MTSHTHIHPLDDALLLQPTAPGVFTGRTTEPYWNMVGPYGGVTAATLLQGVLQHRGRLGDPLSLTVNYAGAVTEGAFTVRAQAVRTNRSTQHWWVTLSQADAEGVEQVATTATVITAVRRGTWSSTETPMPTVQKPADYPAIDGLFPVQWVRRYEMRPIAGPLPAQWDGAEHDSLTRLWVRDTPARALDFAALAGISDVFFPRIWRRRATRVPIGTVSMTVYFHAGAELLAHTGGGYLLAQARAQEFRNGFFDQTAQLWNEAGEMLVTTQQIVYYKE